MNIQENLNEFDYIIFKVYYKHGESQTKICNSFYECFKEVLDTILEFLENDIDIFLDNDNLQFLTFQNVHNVIVIIIYFNSKYC